MRLILKASIMVIIFCTISCTSLIELIEMNEFIKNCVITNPNLDQLNDDIYLGEHTSGLVSASVQIEIVNHTIDSFIILEHTTKRGKPAEVLTSRIVEEQSLEVDTISGATISSLVILKAAEIALSQ